MKVFYFLCAGILLAGCYNERKAQKQFVKAVGNYPKIASDYCGSQYPCVDSIVKGDSVVHWDSLWVQGDTVYLPTTYDLSDWQDKVIGHDTLIWYKVCPPSKIITKTITITDTIKQTDKAALKSCEIDRSSLISQLNKKTIELDSFKKKAKTRGWVMWGLVVFIITVVSLNVYLKSKKII